MSTEAVKRKLAAILSADAVGYSRLMAADEAATLKTLNAHRGLMGGLIRQHGGRVVDAVGDNLLAEFPSVVDAVACAVAVQAVLKERNADLHDDRRMPFRIGIHLGDVMVEGDGIVGDGVNIAARLEALADAGGICVSATVHEQIRDKLSHSYEDLGEQSLKNISRPVHVYRVGKAADAPGDEAAKLTVPGFAGRPAIAVLAFDNLSGDPEQEYFADGLAEDLITRLSAFRMFPVIARNSSFIYKGKPVDVKQVSRELGVRYVVEGSVRKAAGRVRVSVQLIDATTGHHVWAERYDRELSDIFALQDEITETIIGSLESALENAERERSRRVSPGSLDAWDCVQRGLWHSYQLTRDGRSKARQLFERAIDLDPCSSLAFVSLASTYAFDVMYEWSASSAESVAHAMRAAEKAVALDGNNPRAHLVLGLAYIGTGEYERARAAFERSLELDPSGALSVECLGIAHSLSGRPDAAIVMIEKAIRLSPRDPWMHEFVYSLGAAHFAAGRYEDAAQCQRKSLELRSDQPAAHRLLAACYGHLGRVAEARSVLDEAFRLMPQYSPEEARTWVPEGIIDHMLEGWRKAGWKGDEQG